MHQLQKNMIDLLGREPENMDDVAEAIRLKVLANTKNRLWGLHWELRYSDQVSNSHSRPLDGVENWGRKPEKPIGYPGWRGRVWARYSTVFDGWGSDYFRDTLSHTGTGGSGSYNGPWQKINSDFFQIQTLIKKMKPKRSNGRPFYEPQTYSWEYRIYESDWPGLQKEREQGKLMAILKGEHFRMPPHRFRWDDEEAVKHDAELNSWLEEHDDHVL